MIPSKIERRFLLKALPLSVRQIPGTLIEEGYMSWENNREIRLYRCGGEQFLFHRERGKIPAKEIGVPISISQFEHLWETTEGCRLEKTRRMIQSEGLPITVDKYSHHLSPLAIAEIQFPSTERSRAFQPPDFFDREITGDQNYERLSLVLHGLPHDSDTTYQIAALPYLFREGRLHLVIVTNSDRSRWIIPKGNPEKGMTHQDVAVMESMEEAGVIGACEPGFRIQSKTRGEKVLYIYPLRVTSLLKKWPESAWRKRAVLPLPQVLRAIKDAELLKSIEELAAMLA
jgi:CYTH domain-containing protein/8-oxo-dGTP pyrophosphatase MutT (NUDIX family)